MIQRGHIAHTRRGFSLVEACISCLIVGTAMVPALQLLGSSAVEARALSELSRGNALAGDLLAEVMQCPFDDQDSDVNETRATFDDLGDYDGLVDVPPSDRWGTPIVGAEGWTRTVQVAFADIASPSTDAAKDEGLIRVSVTATSPGGRAVTHTGLRARASRYDQRPSVSATVPVHIGVTIRGASGGSLSGGVRLVNMMP